MAMSFLNFFKRKAKQEPEVQAPPPRLEKRAADRLSKTVMPSSRAVTPSQHAAATAEEMGPESAAPRTVSFAPTPSAARTEELPRAVALALEPRVERAISLDLVDIVAQMPPGFVRPLENADTERRVLLKAADLERGMANGKPTVAIASIYDQVPDVFVREVPQSDPTQVQLPFSKVLEQFTALQVRTDQYREQAVPHVQTPFLKVTLEDDERFGTRTEILESDGELPDVRLEPATARTLAAAEPEPAAQEKVVIPGSKPAAFPLRMPAPAEAKNGSSHTAASGAATSPEAPARIPFKLSPNGTGASAPESVPASSGPSVPTSSSAPAAPTRIAFKLSPPSDEERPKADPWLTKKNMPAGIELPAAPPVDEPALATSSTGELTISLPLRPILEMLPPMQLIGEPADVVETAKIEVPFALVEPQLVTGRVQVQPEEFAAALPEEYRGMFNADGAMPVSLPLYEVLKNLPSASLRMRDDQEEQEQGANFATPFSAKAEEDAKRFNLPGKPVPKPAAPEPAAVAAPAAASVAAPAPIAMSAPVPMPVVAMSTAVEEPASTPVPLSSRASKDGGRTELQTIFNTDEELDPKAVVAHVGRMEGVQGCAIVFDDGLSLAGNLPEQFAADGISAVAPSLIQRLQQHVPETKLGAFRSMTMSCSDASITFFTHSNLCLAALHAKEEISSETRDRLARVVHELSKTYSHPA
jgi:predicted regulator of Ras-like GTPase activity (Roadblock/LC7/MglB family)